MTAVFVPEKPSRFARTEAPAADPTAPVAPDDVRTGSVEPDQGAAAPRRRRAPAPDAVAPQRRRREAAFRPAADAVTPVGPGASQEHASAETETEPTAPPVAEGYVVFHVGATAFSVSVGEVREIVRAARLELLPDAQASYGHGVALVDARGKSVPVVDLRSDRSRTGDVLLPMWRHQVGLVVDRVVAVQTPRELVREHDDVPAALPSYARGVLRPADGGTPVLLITMPDAVELAADAVRDDGARIGSDVLAALGLDEPDAAWVENR